MNSEGRCWERAARPPDVPPVWTVRYIRGGAAYAGEARKAPTLESSGLSVAEDCGGPAERL